MVEFMEQLLAAKLQLVRAQSDMDNDFTKIKCAALDLKIDAPVHTLDAPKPTKSKSWKARRRET